MMILLQMVNNTTEEARLLSQTAIDLAEAASNYGALKVVFGVFLVIMIFMVITFIAQTIYILKKVQKIAEASDRVLSYFNPISNRTIGEDEAITILKESMSNRSTYIKYSILRIKLENHINDEQTTETKIRRILANSNAEASAFLSKFIIENKGKNLGTVINFNADNDVLYQLLWEQVYQPKDIFSISSMDQTIELFMNGLKLNYISKLEKL